MPVALTLLAQQAFNGVDNDQKIARIYFTVTPSGNYAALGDTMDFTTLGDAVISGSSPLFVIIQSAKTGGVSGYIYEYTPGSPATQANGKFQVQVSSTGAANTDLGAGAYPAAILADTIVGYADFARI